MSQGKETLPPLGEVWGHDSPGKHSPRVFQIRLFEISNRDVWPYDHI